MSRHCDYCHLAIDGPRVTISTVLWPDFAATFEPLRVLDVDGFKAKLVEQDEQRRTIGSALDLHIDCYLDHYVVEPLPQPPLHSV